MYEIVYTTVSGLYWFIGKHSGKTTLETTIETEFQQRFVNSYYEH
jgi:hypothetical protein